MKKHFFIFLSIFLFLTITIHFSIWIEHPIEHIMALPHADAYGAGMAHPLLFSSIVYGIVSLLLWIVHLIRKLF